MTDHHTADDIANQVARIVDALAHPPKPPLDDSDYSRFVEGPRRAGIDPGWRAITRSTVLPPPRWDEDNPQPIYEGVS